MPTMFRCVVASCLFGCAAVLGAQLSQASPRPPLPRDSQPDRPGLYESQPDARLSPAFRAVGTHVLNKAIAYLRTQQKKTTGSWGDDSEHVSAITMTGLVLDGMLQHPDIDATDPAVEKGIAFLLSSRRPDGGIYDHRLPVTSTAVALSALARAGTPEADATIPAAQQFLIGRQWSENSKSEEISETLGVGKVSADHPFYGGVGYDTHKHPDLFTLSLVLQALHDSGYDAKSPPFQRAVVFLERVQMDSRISDMSYAQGSRQGGFIDAIGSKTNGAYEGASRAGTIEETLDDGRVVRRPRCSGIATYAGFKSYLMAQLPRDDLRVTAARSWIADNYTLSENPGLGGKGYYQYLATFARALDAWDEPTIESGGRLAEPSRPTGKSSPSDAAPPRWAEDLITTLAGLQLDDGSFAIRYDEGVESDSVLVTAYAVLALQAALGNGQNTSLK